FRSSASSLPQCTGLVQLPPRLLASQKVVIPAMATRKTYPRWASGPYGAALQLSLLVLLEELRPAGSWRQSRSCRLPVDQVSVLQSCEYPALAHLSPAHV